MKLDHVAYRVANKDKAAEFICNAFYYEIVDTFKIIFDDESTAQCYVLSPLDPDAPEIFISDGTPGSIVDRWVKERGGVGGIHHLAFHVEDIHETMRLWIEEGLAEFTTEAPISNSNNLTQVFTKPHPLTGVIYEFITRGEDNKGFNVDSVRDLMESTDGL